MMYADQQANPDGDDDMHSSLDPTISCFVASHMRLKGYPVQRWNCTRDSLGMASLPSDKGHVPLHVHEHEYTKTPCTTMVAT